jgi:hypothetical protein
VCAAQSSSTCSTRFGANSWKLLSGVRSPLLSRSFRRPVKWRQRFSSSSSKHVTRNVQIKLVGNIIIICDLPLQEMSRVKQILTTKCIKLKCLRYITHILSIINLYLSFWLASPLHYSAIHIFSLNPQVCCAEDSQGSLQFLQQNCAVVKDTLASFHFHSNSLLTHIIRFDVV